MMTEEFTYRDYVNDKQFIEDYNSYQSRYVYNQRESDKVLINLIKDSIKIGKYAQSGDMVRLLDIGCSTGNLLFHLKRSLPEISLFGADLAESSLKICRDNPELSDVVFSKLDMLNLNQTDEYDIVVANAVAVYFHWDEYRRAAESVFDSLKSRGSYLAFEWIHPFSNQDLRIHETTLGHPDGIEFALRPMKKVKNLLLEVGFRDVKFFPFELGIELPKTNFDEEVVSYTRRGEHGENFCFRGALFQPWCHLVAIKS